MRTTMWKSGLLTVAALVGSQLGARAADNFSVDPAHTGVSFKVEHMGLSWTHGRFNDIAGQFRVDADNPSASRFELTIKTESVDTANKTRDEHLASPDSFNVKQFPVISFKSTAVKPAGTGLYDVTGDLTMHGVTRPVVLDARLNKAGQHPMMKVPAIGFDATATIKRSDFGVGAYVPAVSDEIRIRITTEAEAGKGG